MKQLTAGMLLLLCFTFVQTTKGQSTENTNIAATKIKKSEFILEVPRMESQKLLPIFLDKIRQKSNVHFRGFCQSRNLLLIESGRVELNEVLQILDELGLKYFMKEGASIHTAIRSCGSSLEVEESLKQYLNQASGHE